MGEENKIRDAADAIKGVVEAVPVYQDILQPAAKEVGTALQTVAKAIHVALSPVSALIWGFEQIKEYLSESLAEKLKYTPPERIITPNPAIAGPVIESLRFTANEPSLRELYSNLLATSMDSENAHKAHPAFVEILKQLSPDEARILKYLADRYTKVLAFPFLSGDVDVQLVDRSDPQIIKVLDSVGYSAPFLSMIGHDAGCGYPDLLPSYMNNLSRLGLIETFKDDEGYEAYERFFDLFRPDFERLQDAAIKEHGGKFEGEVQVMFGTERKYFRITPLGAQFFSACIG
jgi:hypothetical protein